MFSEEMEKLIEITLQDGVLTDQEKRVLVKRAEKEGIDIDELDVYIQSLLQKRNKETAETEAENARQSKVGDIKKCPNCGAPVQSGWAACPECGFAFHFKTDFNSSLVSLQKTLQKINDAWRPIFAQTKDDLKLNSLRKQCAGEKNTAIMNAVIRNSREELLDLLAHAMPKANKSGKQRGYTQSGAQFKAEDFGFAYWTLFENCINAARPSFSSDPAFKQYFSFYDQELAKPEKKGFFEKLFGK